MDIQTEVQKIHHQFGVSEKANYEIQKLFDKAIKEAVTEALHKHDAIGSLQDIQEVIEFLQWAFRKVDKGDTPQETVRMLLMNRTKIDNIKFECNDR